jgi:hypothetical protein
MPRYAQAPFPWRALTCQTRCDSHNPLTGQGFAAGGELTLKNVEVDPDGWLAMWAHLPSGRMKQTQSETARYYSQSRMQLRDPATTRTQPRTDRPPAREIKVVDGSGSWFWAEMCLGLAGALWSLVTAPFRLVFWAIAWVGRLTAILLGICLMVVGIALWAGSLFFLGIPMFLIGLVLTLKCLN